MGLNLYGRRGGNFFIVTRIQLIPIFKQKIYYYQFTYAGYLNGFNIIC